MRKLAAVAILSGLCASWAHAEPNIVLILADDAGYGDFGCFGGRQLPTPQIDKMAGEGMKFTQFYAGSTVCAPSRCVLMTGLHTGHCRVRGNSPGQLLPEDVTLAEVLRDAGYDTACIGKWGLGTPPLDDPAQNGFDEFYGYISMWHAHNFYPEFLIENGRKAPLRNEVEEQWKDNDGRGIATKKVDYAPDLIHDRAIEFITRDREKPFFLYYALNIPHANNEAGRGTAPEKGMEVPSFGPYESEAWPAPEKGFAAIMHNVDRYVGRVLESLREKGIDENTIVIFTSDNGPHQEGGHQMDFFDSNGPLRGKKRDIYEGGVRVPMVARWPSHIKAGTSSDLISGFHDLLPTLAEAAGVKPPESDGFSMLPTLTDSGQQQEHAYLYWEFTERGGKRGLRMGNWKIIQLGMSSEEPLPPELYNLEKDLGENHNIAGKHTGLVKRLTEVMDAAHERNESYPFLAAEK